MDDIRSCYRTKIRPFKDSDIEVTIRWYFADPDAKRFPGWHLFSSLNWEGEQLPGATPVNPGEVPGAARPWCDGSKPFPIGFDGQDFCGPIEYFREGQPLAAGLEPWPEICPCAAAPVVNNCPPPIDFVFNVDPGGDLAFTGDGPPFTFGVPGDAFLTVDAGSTTYQHLTSGSPQQLAQYIGIGSFEEEFILVWDYDFALPQPGDPLTATVTPVPLLRNLRIVEFMAHFTDGAGYDEDIEFFLDDDTAGWHGGGFQIKVDLVTLQGTIFYGGNELNQQTALSCNPQIGVGGNFIPPAGFPTDLLVDWIVTSVGV